MLDKGRRFRPIGVPRARGAADDVVTINRHGKGRAEFLALNGHNLQGKGPVQLIRVV